MPLKPEVGLLHAKFLRISYEKTKLIGSGKADIFASKLTEKNKILHQIELQLQFFGSNPDMTLEYFCKYFYEFHKQYGVSNITSPDDFYKQFTQEDVDSYTMKWRDRSPHSRIEQLSRTPSLTGEFNYTEPTEQKVVNNQSSYALFPPAATTTTSNDTFTTTSIPSKGYEQ